MRLRPGRLRGGVAVHTAGLGFSATPGLFLRPPLLVGGDEASVLGAGLDGLRESLEPELRGMRQQFAAALNDQDSETAGGLEAASLTDIAPGSLADRVVRAWQHHNQSGACNGGLLGVSVKTAPPDEIVQRPHLQPGLPDDRLPDLGHGGSLPLIDGMEEKSASPAHFGSLLSLDTHTTNPQHLRYHVQGSLTIRLRFRKAGLKVSYRRFKLNSKISR